MVVFSCLVSMKPPQTISCGASSMLGYVVVLWAVAEGLQLWGVVGGTPGVAVRVLMDTAPLHKGAAPGRVSRGCWVSGAGSC